MMQGERPIGERLITPPTGSLPPGWAFVDTFEAVGFGHEPTAGTATRGDVEPLTREEIEQRNAETLAAVQNADPAEPNFRTSFNLYGVERDRLTTPLDAIQRGKPFMVATILPADVAPAMEEIAARYDLSLRVVEIENDKQVAFAAPSTLDVGLLDNFVDGVLSQP